jgi:hypothetical protein
MKSLSSMFVFVLLSVFSVAQVTVKPHHKTIVSEVRNPNGFSSIHNSSSADLIITQGDQRSVVVRSSEKELIPHIKTTIKNQTLYVSIDAHFRNVEVIELKITIPELTSLTVAGSGDAIFTNVMTEPSMGILIDGSGDVSGILEVDKLNVKVNGSGDVDLAGVNNKLNVEISGSGDVFIKDVKLNECVVFNHGSGDVKLEGKSVRLNVNTSGSGDLMAYGMRAILIEAVLKGSGDMKLFPVNSFKAMLEGSGDIYYRGSPSKVEISEKGSGEIIRR